jgi:hypothetical protein
MAQRGMQYPLDRRIYPDLDPLWSDDMGRTDPSRAARWGYAATPADQPQASGSSPDTGALLAAMSEAERDAWSRALSGEPYSAPNGPTAPRVYYVDANGDPTGRSVGAAGCVWETRLALHGGQERFVRLTALTSDGVFRNKIYQRATSDSRTHAARRAWSECMTGKGYHYSKPFDPVNKFGADVNEPSVEEIATAVDDVACKQSSGLIATYTKVRDAYSRDIAAEHLDVLLQNKDDWAVAFTNSVAADQGELELPWRASESAVSNAKCTWLPPANLRPWHAALSTGQRSELRTYLEAGGASDPPAWIINGGRCEALTSEELEQAVSTALAQGA